MPTTGISPTSLRDMMINVSDGMVSSKELLTEADRMGDADHGEGMARGFTEVKAKLETMSPESVAGVLKAVGVALLRTVGGAAGAVFGTMFQEGAKNLGDASKFDSKALATFLSDGLDGVKRRGKSDVGQKTMLDALSPAAAQAASLQGGSLSEVLGAAAAAAHDGMEKTKEMVATVGKAKTLGERSKGHPDPGAVSVSLILRYMADYLSGS